MIKSDQQHIGAIRNFYGSMRKQFGAIRSHASDPPITTSIRKEGLLPTSARVALFDAGESENQWSETNARGPHVNHGHQSIRLANPERNARTNSLYMPYLKPNLAMNREGPLPIPFP